MAGIVDPHKDTMEKIEALTFLRCARLAEQTGSVELSLPGDKLYVSPCTLNYMDSDLVRSFCSRSIAFSFLNPIISPQVMKIEESPFVASLPIIHG